MPPHKPKPRPRPRPSQRDDDAAGLPARKLAVDVLIDVAQRDLFADAALSRSLARSSLSEVDRGLATLIVYGTIARQLTLDAHIGFRIDKPVSTLDPAVLVLLRSAFFQLLFLDRVPPYAVVDSAVELAKRLAPKAGGLINAVLRRALREDLKAPDFKDDLERAAFEFSHPAGLVQMWRDELGREQADALMEANNGANPVVLRALIDRDKALEALQQQGIEASEAYYAPAGIVVPRSVETPGIAIAQAESSQLVCALAGVRPGDRILDACASPGGKTAYLSLLAGPKGKVVAIDPTRGADDNIRATIERARSARRVAPVDAQRASITMLDPKAAEPFDVVLVDAPCSGLGTLRQHPEIRWRRNGEDITRLAAEQLAILEGAARFVRPGGTLIYSTCTIAEAENQALVRDFLEGNPRFANTGFPADVLGPELTADLVADDGSLQTFPHRHNTDGFFAVRMTAAL